MMPGMMKKSKKTVMYKDGGKVGSCGGKKMKYKKGGKVFKPCPTCPTPGACKKAGKCKKKGK